MRAGQPPFKMAVFLAIFNRPETTKVVIESLAQVRPPAIYIAADGPRAGVASDEERCAAARQVATSIDWPCEVHTLMHDRNLGCAGNTSTGITWFLDDVPEGVILDDDCVPSVSFYRFCEELLEYYRDNPRIMHIAGNSHQYGRRRGTGSYYFSRYANFWGWATWRRAWRLYDPDLRPAWELLDDWSAPWQLSIEAAKGIAIVPNANLVKNIGFGPGATHTNTPIRAAMVEAEEMTFPLIHPESMIVDRQADIFTYYAHHRLIDRHWLIWWFRLTDFIRAKLKPLRQKLFGPRGQPHSSSQP